MARRGNQRFEKRQLEQTRLSKQAAKRERRQARTGVDDDAAVDVAGLNERFRILSERRAADLIDQETYERERHEIFVALGLETDDSVEADH